MHKWVSSYAFLQRKWPKNKALPRYEWVIVEFLDWYLPDWATFKIEFWIRMTELQYEKLQRPGIEPGPPAWQARILPLNQRCVYDNRYIIEFVDISFMIHFEP